MRRFAPAGYLSIAVMLAGCAGGQSLLDSPTVAAVGVDITMPGRWILSAPNAPDCGMNFSAAPGKNEGVVIPEGGCPGRFFTSKRWRLDKNTLAIVDYEDDPLATLTFASGQFEGKSVNDVPVTLKR